MSDSKQTTTLFTGAASTAETSRVTVTTVTDSREIYEAFLSDQQAEDEAKKHGQALPFAPVTP